MLFLLSPALTTGKRAVLLFRQEAAFPLVLKLRKSEATLKDTFSFLSGLYFRGKAAYAEAFSDPKYAPLVITASKGFLPLEKRIGLNDLEEFSKVEIKLTSEDYVKALTKSAVALKKHLPRKLEIVLLGSIAQGKYLEVLVPIFGNRLLVPKDFVGLGDMSRGALLLRAARAGIELEYLPAAAYARRKGTTTEVQRGGEARIFKRH